MENFVKLFTALLFFSSTMFLIGCGGTGNSSVSGSVGYGVYHGYNYPYHRHGAYYNDDIHVHVDRDDVRKRRQQQNIQAARSQAVSMGRPVRTGRGGRR